MVNLTGPASHQGRYPDQAQRPAKDPGRLQARSGEDHLPLHLTTLLRRSSLSSRHRLAATSACPTPTILGLAL
jgi:hypothetical protein